MVLASTETIRLITQGRVHRALYKVDKNVYFGQKLNRNNYTIIFIVLLAHNTRSQTHVTEKAQVVSGTKSPSF